MKLKGMYGQSAILLGAALCALAVGAPVASAGTGTIEMSIDSAGTTQLGRIFRDAIPSSCPSKAYPGIFNPGIGYGYETHAFLAPLTGCASFTRTSASCDTNAHLSIYEGTYEPANQSAHFLGDQGSSVDGETFSVEVTAGQAYVLVASNTSVLESCDLTVELSVPGYAPPDTVIDSGPSGTIAASEATFAFHGNPTEDTARIQCRVDGGDFGACSSPKTFAGLAAGAHTAEFRAEDGAGFQDATPASRTFSVDTTTSAAPTPTPTPVTTSPDTCSPARAALAGAQKKLKLAKKRVAKAKGQLEKANAAKKAKKKLGKAKAAKKAAAKRVKAAKAAVGLACA
jgi:hypothetical protein